MSANRGDARSLEALVYVRVSTDKQERDGTSLEAQLSDCRRYVHQHGWLLGDEYKDVLSGRRADHPGYQALLAEVRRLRRDGRGVAVVTAALDRLGRRLLEQVRAREELTELGVAVHCVREGGVLPELTANLLASVAQDEAARTSRRVREGRAYTASRGFRSVGRAPWGYAWREATEEERRRGVPRKVLAEDPLSGPFVREAFRRIADDGASIRRVAAWIRALPVEVRGGRQRGYRTVQAAVRAPVYAGRSESPADVPVLDRPKGEWPALVDASTWTRVQGRIARHADIPRQASGTYLLTGLLRCGLRMQGWRRPDHDMYTCSAPGKGCYRAARVSAVDGVVRDAVGRLLGPVAGEHGLAASVRRAWASLSAPKDRGGSSHRLRALEQVVARSQARMDAAMDRLLDGTIDKAEYDRARHRHNAEVEAAYEEMSTIRRDEAPPDLPPLEAVLRHAGTWGAVLAGSDVAAQRDVVALLVERVVPERIARGVYTARLVWTPLGRALGALPGLIVAA